MSYAAAAQIQARHHRRAGHQDMDNGFPFAAARHWFASEQLVAGSGTSLHRRLTDAGHVSADCALCGQAFPLTGRVSTDTAIMYMKDEHERACREHAAGQV